MNRDYILPEQNSGIYKITFDNNKIYIGRTNNLKRRMIEHTNKDIKEHPQLLLSKAILKHKIISVELIEYIKEDDIKKMKEREIF